MPELLMASGAAALLGAVMAIAVTSANSGAETGTLAREIDNLAASQSDLAARAERMSADVVSIRSTLDSQSERLARQDEAERSLRTEIAAVAGQVSALTGAGGGAPTPGTSAANTPLGVLLARLTRLETILAEDAATPSTTGQMQRALRDLKTQVEQLYAANAALTETLGQREASILALETSLGAVTGEVASLKGERAAAREVGFGLGMIKPDVARQPVMTASADVMRAFSLMELAAERGSPFVTEQQALALLLPHDRDVVALAEAARKSAPTLSDLKLRFEMAAQFADRLSGGKSNDGWAWLRASLPEVSGRNDSKSAALIAEARAALETDDLRAAAASLARLGEPEGTLYDAWNELALRRANLEERILSLRSRLNRAALGSTEG